MDSLAELRRGINRISLLLCLTPAALFAAPGYLVSVAGAYSFGSTAAPAGLSSVYSDFKPEYRFTDYGGRFYRLMGPHGIGFSIGLVSSLNSRGLYVADSPAVADFVGRVNVTAGSGHQFSAGKYSLGLGWVPVLARYRYAAINEFVFIELGAGPVYGFGALESEISATNGNALQKETRYHRYNEWGIMTSFTIGASWPLAPGLSVQLLAEVAWLYARVRDPNIFVSDSVGWSHFFVRPGLALAFSF